MSGATTRARLPRAAWGRAGCELSGAHNVRNALAAIAAAEAAGLAPSATIAALGRLRGARRRSS